MAVALFSAGLVVFLAGSVEALGYASGRTTINLTDLPFGPTKAEHIELLQRLASDDGVDLALLVPDRSGAPGELDAYVLHGDIARPAFWGEITDRPVRDIGDAVIVWTYAIDGSGPDVSRFLGHLGEAGFTFSRAEPLPLPTLLEALMKPGVAGIGFAVSIALLIALVSESHHRAPRQRVRRLAGWTLGRIAARELMDIAVLLLTAFAAVFAGLAGFLAVRGASDAVWVLCWTSFATVSAIALAATAGSHVGFAVISGRQLGGPDVRRWRPVLTAASGIALVAVLVGNVSTITSASTAARALEASLAAEAAHGDDVVLGVGFAGERQDLALGSIGAAAIERKRARMAMTNAFPDALLVAGSGTTGLPESVARRDGVTVLVPEAMHGRAHEIENEVRSGIAEGWALDDADPPRTPSVSTEVVESTAPIVEAADRWVDWGAPKGPTWPEIAVVVVSDVKDIAPNRVGTATHNGEVRFSDRASLEQALHDEHVFDVVTQVNAVGAVIDRRLAAVRSDRIVLAGASLAALVAALFAAGSLVTSHLRRGQRAHRLLRLVGRHPAVLHRSFVLGAAATSGSTALLTRALGTSDPAEIFGTALAAGSATALVLSVLIALDHVWRRRA
ncbi:hypothetical protein ACLBWP_04515 [Microbacterium sp. M1A1_1b]